MSNKVVVVLLIAVFTIGFIYGEYLIHACRQIPPYSGRDASKFVEEMQYQIELYEKPWLTHHLWIFIIILIGLTVIACVSEYRCGGPFWSSMVKLVMDVLPHHQSLFIYSIEIRKEFFFFPALYGKSKL